MAPHHIAVSHDRCHLAVTTENDDSTGPLLVAADGSARHLHAAGGETNGIAWSPDNRSVAVSYQLAENSSIRIVDAATGDAHELTHFHGPSLSYRVAWLDDQTVLDLRITHGGFVVDTVNAAGGVQPYLTPADLRVGGIDGNTFAVDAAHHRLLLLVFSGTFTHQHDRRLVWVDLDSRRITPATTAALRPLDAQLGATFGPNGRGIAFMTGRAGAGRYACVVLRGAKRTQLPGNDQCDEIAWG